MKLNRWLDETFGDFADMVRFCLVMLVLTTLFGAIQLIEMEMHRQTVQTMRMIGTD